MITTEGLTTTVKFGTDEKASISVMSSKRGLLTLQMLAKEKQIGDILENEDIKELPKIEIEFFTPRSIDVMILHLNRLKRSYESPARQTMGAVYTIEGSMELAKAC